MNSSPFNKNYLIRSFNRSADTFQKARTLHHEIGERLLKRLDFIKISPEKILDIGAADGLFTAHLSQKYPAAQTIGLDIAKKRLFQTAKNHPLTFLCADAEHLPLSHQSIDLVFSNLTLHWCANLFSAFQQTRSILRPSGVFLFSMLGVDTLKEIRQCWQCLDDHAHVYDFLDMHQVGDALLQAGFQDPVMDMEQVTLEYPNFLNLFQDLKKSGTTNVSPNRAKGLLSRQRYQQFVNLLEQQYTLDKTLPITFEIIYGYAFSQFAVIKEP